MIGPERTLDVVTGLNQSMKRLIQHSRWMLALPMLAVAVLAGAACQPLRPPNPFASGPDGETKVSVQVQNRNFADATIHVLRGGELVRLGVVNGAAERTFELVWRISMPMRVNIRLLAGGECLTDDMMVDPGDRLFVEVPVDLANDPDCRSTR
jgi:hypothetical protein